MTSMTTSPTLDERSAAVLTRNNVHLSGRGDEVILFAHGFGCDQLMWRHVAPAFEREHRVVLMDHVGSGKSDRSAYRVERYASLQGYADDTLEVLEALDARRVVFVGHSVSAMIGVLACKRAPEIFSSLVMVGPSPRYIDDDGYVGGFDRTDIEELLALIERNHLEWSRQMAPVIMSNADRPELTQELANSFCQMDPLIARHFARVTFLSDLRAELPSCRVPSLILQCTKDVIAPIAVGEYLHRTLPDSDLVVMSATGHCPHLSAPEETTRAIRRYLLKLAQRKSQERRA
jgi:sigma-B regulation protein RsbQ